MRRMESNVDSEQEKECPGTLPLDEVESAGETQSVPESDVMNDIGADAVDNQSVTSVTTSNRSNFGEQMDVLKLSPVEVTLLRKSFDLLLDALGNDREAVGDAIYGSKIGALVAIKDKFSTPRAVVSLRFFNCFRLLLDKAEDPDELKVYVETLAFKHLGIEVLERRVDAVIFAFNELLIENVPDLPPGTSQAWQNLLGYAGSCYRFVGDTYGERLQIIKDDWVVVQAASVEKDSESGENGEKDGNDTMETFSFDRMCAFSSEVMGQKTEGWMVELLSVFHILVDMISSPVHLQEECDLLAINLIVKSQDIVFEKFKPVMLAALRSLLPKQWSSKHETAWEWLWVTVARNLKESTMKVRAFKPYNAKLFSSLSEEQLDRFRVNIFTEFFVRSAASQELFKQSKSRLRYIADRVLQSSYDMFHKNKDDTLDTLSALGLRHVGYGIPIELFGPFAEVCVDVLRPMIQDLPKDSSSKMVWCPKDNAHQLPEQDIPEHLMLEGFRWSISLTARLLVRTIMDGSTAVMQAIHLDDSKRLRRALLDAPRDQRCIWQLAVQVGSQSISPLFWALRSGAHSTAKAMIEDVLTIRADRDNYYYGADELFKYQPNIADNILREAPFLAETLLDGLIWRSHKSEDNLRPVIYYVKHLLQDMDENQMLSRALVSYVRFNHPQTVMHPLLTFTLDLLWEKMAKWYFLKDRLLTVINGIIFVIAECLISGIDAADNPTTSLFVAVMRCLVYGMGFFRLLFWHMHQIISCLMKKELSPFSCFWVPQYLTRGSNALSFILMLNLLAMITVEPMIHCVAESSLDAVRFACLAWTDEMSLAYEVFVVFGVFIYVTLIVDVVFSIFVKLSEYKVLCLHAVEQVLLCFAAIFVTILAFALAVSGMPREVSSLSQNEWGDVGSTLSTLIRLAFGVLDMEPIQDVAQESSLVVVVIVLFLMVTSTFFFNILVSQFCGVYTSLAADIKGHARLARGEIIIETFKAVKHSKWQNFVESLNLEKRIDFDKGDIGLAGGIKDFEPALAHPVAKDPIVRFGGNTDPSLPWPEKIQEDRTLEQTIHRTIQKSLQKMLGKSKLASTFSSVTDGSSSLSSSKHSE